MPPTGLQSKLARTLEELVASVGSYPIDAYFFLQEGLHYAAERAHGALAEGEKPRRRQDRHINGRQLCEGLRDLALERWGLMARAVLGTWNIRGTDDFGRIVFAMIDAGLLQKRPDDTISDFDDVYDFRRAFDVGYTIRLPERLDA
jgi:uncharacterized repeat protein (TIGR04138 family)